MARTTFKDLVFGMVSNVFEDAGLIHPMGVLDLKNEAAHIVRIEFNPSDEQIGFAIDDALASFPACRTYAIFYEARSLAHAPLETPGIKPLSTARLNPGVLVATDLSEAPARCVFVVFAHASRRPELWMLPVLASKLLGAPEDVSHLQVIDHVRPFPRRN